MKTDRADAGTGAELQASSLLSGYKAKQLWKTAWLFHTEHSATPPLGIFIMKDEMYN